MLSTSVLLKQVYLLLWKRYREVSKSKFELVRILGPPIIIFVLIHLAYATIPLFFPAAVEPFLVPFAFFLFIQRVVIQITYEKANRLQEAMKMMGMIEPAYWISYFISDAVIIGFLMAFMSAVVSGQALFNDANFGEVLGVLLVFCLSVVPFCFFLSIFFDTPESAGQGALGVFIGCYAVYVIVFLIGERSIPLYNAQVAVSFFPPIALQLACGSFLRSHEGINRSSICGIMFADIFIYSALTWYLSHVWPSKYGLAKPFYFFLMPSYWTTKKTVVTNQQKVIAEDAEEHKVSEEGGLVEGVNYEAASEHALGKPTVAVHQLRKTFGRNTVVNNLSFTMYENQIFSLLGHNGAGKTTTINMLTGLFQPDVSLDGTKVFGHATIYGNDIHDNMEKIRLSMGVCPQHDVLFDSLSVREHILLFAQLKGMGYAEAEAEAVHLTKLFHLENRLDNTGEELSGGQKRKLSVAIAVCGGSKFVVLDEPTAGMDPLARRELWNLLAHLRKGRTMLLTTHYMDEADILGDRIGIMAKGKMVCCGTSQFLKLRYGPGYKLVVEHQPGKTGTHPKEVLALIRQHVPNASIDKSESAYDTFVYVLPYTETNRFAKLFQALDDKLVSLEIKNYGLSGSSLEDVFVRAGGEVPSAEEKEEMDNSASNAKNPSAAGGVSGDDDDAVVVSKPVSTERIDFNHGQKYDPHITTQILGVAYRKLSYAMNDFTTIPLLLIPICASIGAAVIYSEKLISPFSFVNAVVANGLYTVGYVGIPGILAEFIVRERNDKLRNVLNVMGCDFRAYWIGNLIADYLLLLVPAVGMWITWGVFDMENYYASKNGLNFFIVLLFNAQIISFAYCVSYLFNNPKSCITFTPTLLIALNITPSFLYTLFNQFLEAFDEQGGSPSEAVGTVIYWFTDVMSPQGGLFASFLSIGEDLTLLGVTNFPPYGASIAIMFIQTFLFLGFTMWIDERSISTLDPITSERIVDETALDSDVVEERHRVAMGHTYAVEHQGQQLHPQHADNNASVIEMGSIEAAKHAAESPLLINRLRRIYPPVKVGGDSVIAVEDVSFGVAQGEVFGLLGANGVGKTTLLSMLTRLTAPTSGDAYIAGQSILSSFRKVAKYLGVVTQNNALWDRLSVENHLYLFARLRGVSEKMVSPMVEEVLTSLELKPHRYKLAMRLSGGMKRKLCCAIALIGDPKVVLLDEPSAGLDPLSRRHLWNVILRTMAHRSVILTTHSMEEAEALCNRLGVMVQGQLRAMGSKQHLKSKFGSGYEVTVKVNTHPIAPPESFLQLQKQPATDNGDATSSQTRANLLSQQLATMIQEVTSLMTATFPSAKLVYDNGGLTTFEIPKTDMQMSRLFNLLEETKVRRGWIEDYSIAQPTLEQVFIRIVNDSNASLSAKKHELEKEEEDAAEHDRLEQDTNDSHNKEQEEYKKKRAKGLRLTRAKCGCGDDCLRIVVYVCLALGLAMVIAGGVIGVSLDNAVGGAVSITIGVVFFITMVVHLCLLCCLSCRNPIEEL